MLGNLTGWHLLIILAVVLLVFGASKLPGLAKAMGQSARILKSELKVAKPDTDAVAKADTTDSVDPATTPAPAPAPAAPRPLPPTDVPRQP
ncbi:hypothetical protein GCM10027406_00160 [Leifsonia lichenia]